MTTTNIYQGAQAKSTSRVLQAPGGASSGIFGHYEEQDANERARQREQEMRKVEQSLSQGGNGDQNSDNFHRDKDSFAANRNRNHGTGAPFATGESMAGSGSPQKATQMQGVIGDDYQTPQQRQAQNPNKGQNTFNNLFGDTDEQDGDSANGKTKGKGTFNPITGREYPGENGNPSTRVHAPPGGQSSIQF